MKAVIVWVAVAFLGLSASSCLEQGSGHVWGERLEVADCGDVGVWEPFTMELTYLSALRAGDVVLLRVSDSSQLIEVTDSLTIYVPSYDDVQARIQADGVATFPIGSEGVSASLVLLNTCPSSTTPLLASTGTITFYQLGTVTGEVIKAEMSFELTDARSAELIGLSFQASIDFEVRAGTPYESFSDPRRQRGE
jgi:hypothetical protein